MNGLRELLKESEAMPIVAEAEERQLRETISATKEILEQARSVLRECCAWESSAPSVQALVQFEAAIPLATHKHPRVVRGRPDVYTPGVVRSLLQAHISQNADTTSFEALPVEKRPSMEAVGELLVRAEKNPVKISEMAYLEDLHRRGLQLVDSASTILVRASQLSVAKSRLTLDRVRYTIQEVQGLLRSMHSFPFRSREVDALQALVSRAEAWRKEVVAMSGGALVNETDAAAENGKANQNSRAGGSRRSEAAAAASNKPIPLKKVESLIAEGERFPFEFKDELEVLRDKKDLAKLWLEKLKRSFVPTKVNSGRSKKGTEEGGGAAAKAEKLSLSDMKMMVSEGESLYQQPLEDDAELAAFGGIAGGAAVPSLLGRPAASARTVNRELDRAQAVVEVAEDWISRVRDLLAGGSVADEERSDSSSPHLDSSSNADGEGEGDEEEGEEDPERTIQTLRAMLHEAESMPVTLDECGMLRCHLQALEWAAKVRPILAIAEAPPPAEEEPLPADLAVPAEEQGQVQTQGEGEGAAMEEDKAPTASSSKRNRDRDASRRSSSSKASKITGKPRLSDMQQYAKEITRYRKTFKFLVCYSLLTDFDFLLSPKTRRIRASTGGAASSSEIPLKPLPEEVKVLALVSDAEKWLGKIKKLMQVRHTRNNLHYCSLIAKIRSQTLSPGHDCTQGHEAFPGATAARRGRGNPAELRV